MAIKTQSLHRIQLYIVTRHYDFCEDIKVVMSLKELQSELQRYNNIIKIEKAIITTGEEVDIKDIKPKKYKDKPYTYQEKYGNKYIGCSDGLENG